MKISPRELFDKVIIQVPAGVSDVRLPQPRRLDAQPVGLYESTYSGSGKRLRCTRKQTLHQTQFGAQAYQPLKAWFGDKQVLHGIDAEIRSDSVTAIIEGLPLPPEISDVLLRSDTSGFEAWYNLEVASWFNLTIDYQAVKSVFRNVDTSHVLGFRFKIDF